MATTAPPKFVLSLTRQETLTLLGTGWFLTEPHRKNKEQSDYIFAGCRNLRNLQISQLVLKTYELTTETTERLDSNRNIPPRFGGVGFWYCNLRRSRPRAG
jgi:hypothetical protein